MVNIFMTDRFLGGAFLTYGTDVVSFSNMNQENRTDPMVAVFPRVTKCTFHKFGPSGSIQKHDALCILALNILNEKIYIFLWFWFIILAVLSGLAICYSAAVVLLPSTRETILKRRFRFGVPNAVDTIIRKTQVCDNLLGISSSSCAVFNVIERDFMDWLQDDVTMIVCFCSGWFYPAGGSTFSETWRDISFLCESLTPNPNLIMMEYGRYYYIIYLG